MNSSTINYITIPNTLLKVSPICMGGGALCVENQEKSSFELLDKYVDLGGNFIDTANIYGKWLSKGTNISEITIGRWMKSRKSFSNIIIATKGGHPDLNSMNKSRLSQKEIEKDLNESLLSLQTDVIDLYWFHRDDDKLPVGELLEFMNAFVKKGKIRYFGCSNWKANRIREAQKYAIENKIMGFCANQMMWSIAKPNKDGFPDKSMMIMNEATYKLHKETGLTAIPYSSQANGFFEKIKLLGLENLNENLKKQYLNKKNTETYKHLLSLSQKSNISLSHLVIDFLLSQPFTTIPIVGCRTIEQLEASM